jgi:predicted metal-dependent HD superfamily phosphohydrolase
MVNNPFQKYRNLLNTYIDQRSIPVLWNNWNHYKRHYHTVEHLKELIAGIERWRHRLTRAEYDQLILAAFFHDAIYDPEKPESNEDESIKFFRKAYIGKDQKFELVDKLIECTKYRKRPTDFLLKIFWEADNKGFRDPYLKFQKYEKQIRKEYSHVPWDIYKKARIEFLEKNYGLFGPKGDTNIRNLVKWIRDKYDI